MGGGGGGGSRNAIFYFLFPLWLVPSSVNGCLRETMPSSVANFLLFFIFPGFGLYFENSLYDKKPSFVLISYNGEKNGLQLQKFTFF